MGYPTGSNLLELKAIINDVINFSTAQSGLSFNFIICNLWVVFNKVRYLIDIRVRFSGNWASNSRVIFKVLPPIFEMSDQSRNGVIRKSVAS